MKIIKIIGIAIGIGALLSILWFGIAHGAVLQGYQGGTGISTTTVGNVGNCLQVNSSSPFLTWTIGACGSGGGGSGNVLVTPSSSVLANEFLYWTTNGSTTVSPTSTLTFLSNGNINASGTITQNGTAVVLQNRNVNTNAPLSGGGALSGDLTISCATCSTLATSSPTSPGLAYFSNGITLSATTSYVSSFNGATGSITYAPSTTIPTAFVSSFNGSTGAVTGVSSVVSSTGAGGISASAPTGSSISFSVISPLNLATINSSSSQITNLSSTAATFTNYFNAGTGTISGIMTEATTTISKSLAIGTTTIPAGNLLYVASATGLFIVSPTSTHILSGNIFSPDNTAYATSVTAGIASINGDTTAAQKITGSGPISTSTSAAVTTIRLKQGAYTALDGSNNLTVSSTIASSSLGGDFLPGTTTFPYNIELSPFLANAYKLFTFYCWDIGGGGTSTLSVYYATSTTATSTGTYNIVATSTACGGTQVSTTTFATTTLPINSYLIVTVTSTAGTPADTHWDMQMTKQ